VNAARSLLKTFRQLNPQMLRKKDRGRNWKTQEEVRVCVCCSVLVCVAACCGVYAATHVNTLQRALWKTQEEVCVVCCRRRRCV